MKEIKNLPASVRARLFAGATAKGEVFNRILVRYGIERFLFRLSRYTDRDRFVLKGAMLFVTWSQAVYRPTGDLDLLAYAPADPEAMKAIVAEICAIAVPDDAIVFDTGSIIVEAMREDEVYQGLRVAVTAKLGNIRIAVRIDMGFGDAVHPAPREITFPCLLPDMGVPRILAYPPETVVAEKFEAMVRFGEANGRLKDFNDIWAIANTFGFEMATLVQALRGTFERRQATLPADIPFALTAAFAALPEKRRMWDAFLARNPPAVSPPPFEDVLGELRRFIGPVLRAAAHPGSAGGTWSPGSGWTPPARATRTPE